jgi:hypothetical protein
MGAVGEAPIVQLILDGTVVDRDATRCLYSRDLVVLIGAPTGGYKVLLAVKAMDGESAPRPDARWSMISACRPDATRFLVVNRVSDLEPVWDEYRSNRCTVFAS